MQAIDICAGKQGRIVIPSVLRQQLGIKPGTKMFAWIEGQQLILQPKAQLWAAIHQEADTIPESQNMAQTLIDERRQAAKLENS